MSNGTDYDKGKQDGEILQQLKDINSHLRSLGERLEGHDKRIRILENWRWWMLGANLAVGIGAAKVVSAYFL